MIEKLDAYVNNLTDRAYLKLILQNDFRTYLDVMFYYVNGSFFTFKPFHIRVINKLQQLADGKNTKRNLLLNIPVGCLSGDTIIKYNRNKLGRKISIKKAYEYFNQKKDEYHNWDTTKKTYVRSLQKDIIKLNEALDFVYSGKRQVYELILESGDKIKATPEHKIMTKKGWKELINLNSNDLVMLDKPSFSNKKQQIKKIYKRKSVGKYCPYANVFYSKKDKKTYYIADLHRLIYDANNNNLSLDKFIELTKKPNNLIFTNSKQYHIHHIDNNYLNNDLSNLIKLSKEDHLKLHGDYSSFGFGKPTFSKVKTIVKKGIEDVYDIQCKNPYNNFVANNIIVHNSGKSIIIEYFISWCFARNINHTFCYVSHSDRLINRLSKETKDIVENHFWIKVFGNKLKSDDRSKINWSFDNANNRSGLTAGTMLGSLTGLDAGNPNMDGFNGALIIDDPIDADNVKYQSYRQANVDSYDNKLSTRRRTPRTPTILIMQRLHISDLTGWIESTEGQEWDMVKIPAIDEQGLSFWPEKFPIQELNMIEKNNPQKYYSQYQQSPITNSGTLIDVNWFLWTDLIPKEKDYDYRFITADTAYKDDEIEGSDHDYHVFAYWGVLNKKLYLIDYIRKKLNAIEVEAWALPFIEPKINNGFRYVWIEDKGHGIYLNQSFRKKGIHIPPKEKLEEYMKSRRLKKVERANNAIPFIDKTNFNVIINTGIGAEKIKAIRNEFMFFPDGVHDDFVDVAVDAILIGLGTRDRAAELQKIMYG